MNVQLARRRATMLVTRVEDRFGNWLTYQYTGANLSGITASDGRSLSVQYDGPVSAITLNPGTSAARTWTYQYSPAVSGQPMALNAVTLPDGTAWGFNLRDLTYVASVQAAVPGNCEAPGAAGSLTWSGSITHPSGLTGTFSITPRKQGRSYVPQACWGGTSGDPLSGYALTPNAWYGLSVTQKTFSGAGLPQPATWNYQYSAANESWTKNCAGSSCPATVWTDVLDPTGHTVRHTFSNRFDISEGRLTDVVSYAAGAGSAIVRSEAHAYAAPDAGPWPVYQGANLQPRLNEPQITQLAPLNQRTITQDGTTFTWQAQAFNAFAQVTQTSRSNNAGQPTLTEQTTYLNDLPHWVLGLPTQTQSLTYGGAPINEVVDEYNYDLANVTLKWRKRFGQTLMNYTFNSAGQLASFTDGNTNTTTLGNYKRGIPQTIHTPDNKTQSLVVDDLGQITAITDPAGSTTSYTYDAVGRVTGISYPTGDEQSWLPKTFSYAYVTSAERGLSAGHWRRTVTHGNARAVTYFDALLRPVLSDRYINGVSGSNTTALTNYDARGQTIFASYPSENALSFTTSPASAGITGSATSYDALGRLTQTVQASELGALTASTAYLSGARRQDTDPKGNVTTTTYQVFDQPAYGAVIKVVAPAGLTQTITRDLYGNPLTITQSGSYGTESLSVDKTFRYDSQHRLCRTFDPESGHTILDYDGANNLAWSAAGVTITGTGCARVQVLAAARTTRTYDAMNRLWTIQPPSGTQGTVYTYDALGNPETAQSGISLWSATYNKRGMLTAETLQVSGQPSKTQTYLHDAAGHVRQWIYPDGETVAYALDALGRPTQVGSYANGLAWFPNGELAQMGFANGAIYVAEQNARQLLRNFTYGTGSTLHLSEDLSYDNNGNITQFTDLTGGPRSKTLGYDALNRLTSATAPALWGTETYAYDPLNNIRQRVTGTQTTTYHYDSHNRLSSLTGTGATTFGYDSRGNVINQGGVTLTFDQNNQLLSLPGASYAYDASGRRVKKTVSGVDTYYFYSQAGDLLHQWEPALNKSTNFIQLGRRTIARSMRVGSGTPTVIYSYTDAQNTPLMRANASGAVTATFDYTPYGRSALGGPPDGAGYTGHVNDPDTGLVYMQARYYDPVVGRFLSVDPVGPSPGNTFNFNRYDYANNNPIVNTDPDGRKCATTDGKDSCTFDEFRDKKGKDVTRDEAVGGKLSQLFGRGSRILRAERAMTAKYIGAKGLAAKNGAVTIKGNPSLGIADKTVSGATIARSMETITTIANQGPAPNDTATLRHNGGVPSTLDGSPSPGPMQFWSDGANVNVGTLFGHEILHTIYSGIGETNRGWANPDYQLEHQVPFNGAANDF